MRIDWVYFAASKALQIVRYHEWGQVSGNQCRANRQRKCLSRLWLSAQAEESDAEIPETVVILSEALHQCCLKDWGVRAGC